MENKGIIVITGSYDTGKSSVLRALNGMFGYRTLAAASDEVLLILGNRCFHPPDEPFVFNAADEHVCPRCKPIEFAGLVLKKQSETEKESGKDGIFVSERGYCDYLAYLRWSGIDNFSKLEFPPASFARYPLVFLLEVMPEFQESKWGFSKEERVERAARLNELLLGEYVRAGLRVVIIPPGTVMNRALLINEIIRDVGVRPPYSGLVNYRQDHAELLSEVNGFLKKVGLRPLPFLYRVTGEKHLEKVLRYGTDRAGLDNEMRWEERGYIGQARKFEDIIYASTEKEILEGERAEDISTSFKKIPITPKPYLLVYDADKFEIVHRDHQYVFKDASRKKEALLAVLKIKAAQ